MRRKLLIALVLLPVLAVAALLLYLELGDLSWLRGKLERAVTDALGRELTVGGRFDPDLPFSPGLVAENVTLANPPWSDEPAMVHVDRLEISLGLVSLFSGPLRIRELKIQGVRVHLEADGSGRASWQFGSGDAPSDPDPPAPAFAGIIVENVEIRDVELTLRDPSLSRNMTAVVESLDLALDDGGEIGLRVAGRLNEVPIEISGRFDHHAYLLLGKDVRHEIEGRLGSVGFESTGTIADVATLSGADLRVVVHGPDVAEIPAMLGVEPPIDGPFRVAAGISPGANGSDLSLDATLGDLVAEARGSVGALLDPEDLRLAVSASGPDLAGVGALFGLDRLPAGAFDASGELRRTGTYLDFDRLHLVAGQHSIRLDGRLGKPPRFVDTDFNFEAAGPDLSSLASLARVELPAVGYDASGRLVREEGALAIDDVEVRVGDSAIRVDGTLGDYPDFAGTELEVRASVPDPSTFSKLAGIDLPRESFEIEGRLGRGDSGLALEGVSGRVGRNSIRADGTVGLEPGLVGTDVQLHVAGPDLASALAVASFESTELPEEPFEIGGRLRVREIGYDVDAVAASIGDTAIGLSGRIGLPPGFVGTDVAVELDVDDLSRFAALAKMPGLPSDRVVATGSVRVLEEGFELKTVAARIGDVDLALSGRVGPLPDLEGSDVSVSVSGPRLSDVGAFIDAPPLPAEAFAVSGRLRVDVGGYGLDRIVAEVGPNRMQVDGIVGPLPDLVGTDLELDLSGSDLAEALRLASESGLGDWTAAPAKPYSATGAVRRTAAGFDLQDLVIRVGDAEMRVAGRLGVPPELLGTDIAVDAKGPDGRVIAAFAGLTVPGDSFRVSGRVARTDRAIRFEDVHAEFGNHVASVDGILGELPTFEGTDLRFDARGPDLELVSQVLDRPLPPGGPFAISGDLHGTSERFDLKRFDARLGESELIGSFSVDLRGKPALDGEFKSRHLDLTSLLGMSEAGDSAAETGEKPADDSNKPPPATSKAKLVISDEPLELDALDDLDASVRLTATELVVPTARLHDVVIDARLRDGMLRIDPLSAKGELGGTLGVGLTLEPLGSGGYRLEVRGDARQVRLGRLAPANQPDQGPPIDIDLQFVAIGRTPHELLASADGSLLVVLEPGLVDSSVFDALTVDVLVKVLQTLNPFAKEDAYTEMECMVVLTDVRDGVATIKPLAMRSDKMTIVGDGKIVFDTEKLSFVWAAKPRKGIGLSASALTNRFVKVGGRLSNPIVEVKPLDAVTTTGAAVATVGLSIVATGLWDRVTAEKKVCKKALKEVQRRSGTKDEPALSTD